MALSRRKKKPLVLAGSFRTTSIVGVTAPQRPSFQLEGKRTANDLANSGYSFEPANMRPAPAACSAPMPASASAVTGRENILQLSGVNSCPRGRGELCGCFG